MTFSPVTWVYKLPVTLARLQQMADNIEDHDHRADGTQGKAVGKAASGMVTESTRSAAGVVSTPITFPAGRFSAPPDVVVCVNQNASTLLVTAFGVSGITATGATVKVDRNNATATSISWVATDRS